MRVPDEVRQCTVFLGIDVTTDPGHILKFIGSAFFVSIPTEDNPNTHYVYLATAKHVIEAAQGEPILIRANTKDGKSYIMRTQPSNWRFHPTDELADVAVMPWAPPDTVELKHVSREMFLSDEIFTKQDIGVGDEVFLTGLFAHLSGSQRNMPIVRIGNLAMMPDEPIPTSRGPMDGYLVEARSIGGLSGSPVFVREATGMFYLMGLMHGHWDIPSENKNDVINLDANGSVNMGIAIVVPSEKILEVLYCDELVEQRRKADERRLKANQPTPD